MNKCRFLEYPSKYYCEIVTPAIGKEKQKKAEIPGRHSNPLCYYVVYNEACGSAAVKGPVSFSIIRSYFREFVGQRFTPGRV